MSYEEFDAKNEIDYFNSPKSATFATVDADGTCRFHETEPFILSVHGSWGSDGEVFEHKPVSVPKYWKKAVRIIQRNPDGGMTIAVFNPGYKFMRKS